MMREMMQAKLHRGVVSDCRLDYPGSLTVDRDLLVAVGMLPNQKIQLVNINNGVRLETYLIPGGPGEIIVNGAAARLAQPGDRVIIISYAHYDEAELAVHESLVAVLDENNRITTIERRPSSIET